MSCINLACIATCLHVTRWWQGCCKAIPRLWRCTSLLLSHFLLQPCDNLCTSLLQGRNSFKPRVFAILSQPCYNLVTTCVQPVFTTYIYNPSCTKVVTTWLQPCTFCMGYHTTGRKSYTVDSGMTLCCVTLMCTDMDSLCDAHYYSAMHSLHAESETNDISMVGMIVTVHIPYICSTTKLTM